ncbi:MAG: 6-bladed beta-propeller [Elusimicrobiota bacterium]
MKKIGIVLGILFLILVIPATTRADNYTLAKEWGSYGGADGQFDSPSGIAIDSFNNIYVVERYNHRIQKFDSNGNFILKFGSYGNSDGQLKYPSGIAIDSSGNVYVADSGNYRIQKFDSNGNFIFQFGSYGWGGNGLFNQISSIAVDSSGSIYVIDAEYTYQYRIKKFDSNGNFILKWGSNGSGDGQFSYPKGIVCDSSNNVYIADSGNKRIQKFDSNGNFILKWGSYGNGDGQFNYPSGIAVDSSGNVYVADSGNYRIQKFDSTGNFISQFDCLYSLSGIAMDSFNNIYVVSSNKVVKFIPISKVQSLKKEKFFVGKNLFYPNKSEKAQIYYHLNNGSNVLIRVYDIAGDLVKEILDGYCDAGDYVEYWDGSGAKSGLYIISIKTDEYTKRAKVGVVK